MFFWRLRANLAPIPLKAPKGDTAASHTLAGLLRKARTEKEGNLGKRLAHMCQIVLLNVGSITKGRQEAWRLTIKPGGLKIEAWRL